MAIRKSIGRLEMPANLLAVADLPMHHQDPFDRMQVAQARLETMTLMTRDAQGLKAVTPERW